MSKKVYLVRHGESVMGAQKRHQTLDAALSEQGIKQARLLAQRFEKIPIDIVYASPLPRAHQTAEVINTKIGKPIIVNELFHEIKRPSVVLGTPYHDPDILRIKTLQKEHIHDQSWHHSDEENFYDFRDRLSKAIKVLEQEHHEHILVVSHEVVLKVLTMLMTFGVEADHTTYQTFYEHFKMSHTGITLLDQGQHGWRLLTWNDYAHLGEGDHEA